MCTTHRNDKCGEFRVEQVVQVAELPHLELYHFSIYQVMSVSIHKVTFVLTCLSVGGSETRH